MSDTKWLQPLYSLMNSFIWCFLLSKRKKSIHYQYYPNGTKESVYHMYILKEKQSTTGIQYALKNNNSE